MRRVLTANGEYFVFYAPEGKLTERAIPALREAARTGADFIYGDELVIGKDGTERPVKKPDSSPDTLLSYNYVGSPLAVSLRLMEKVGAPASDSYMERWAFALRAYFASVFVLHIPQVLCIGKELQAETETWPAEQALRRLHRPGQVHNAKTPGCVTVRYDCPPETLLSVIVATQGAPEDVRQTLDSLEHRNASARLEYIVADGGAPTERAAAYYDALQDCGVVVLRQWHEPNLAKLMNIAAGKAKGEAMLFLRAGDRILHMDALHYMLPFALLPHVGAVCGWTEEPLPEQAYVQNVRMILRAPMVSRENYRKACGFDESFSSDGCEAALCATLRERQLHLLKTPDAVIALSQQSSPRNEKTALRCRDLSI